MMRSRMMTRLTRSIWRPPQRAPALLLCGPKHADDILKGLPWGCAGHAAPTSGGAPASGGGHAAPNERGAAGLTPPPLHLLLPGGGDGCRVKARSDQVGTGRSLSPGSDRQRGRQMPAVRPIGSSLVAQALSRSSLAEPKRDEFGALAAGLHPYQHRALAVL